MKTSSPTPPPPFSKRMSTDSLMEVCEEVHMDYSLSNMKGGKRGHYAVVTYLEKPHLSRHSVVEAEGKNPSDALFQAMLQAWKQMDHSFDRHVRPTKKGGRKAAKISIEKLQELVDVAIKEHGNHIHTMTCLTPRIEHDIKGKVEFDTENEEFNKSKNCGHWDDLLGYRQWGDLAFLGGMSGGDWESPVFWLIYYDGKELRGYVPKDGNVWNHETKQAVGNDNEADARHACKMGWIDECEEKEGCFDPCDAQYDVDKIRQDVFNRIKVQ